MTAKLRLLCAAAALTVQLPSCNFNMSVETMLAPPRLTAEQEQIYQALQMAGETQISLKYPKSGERLSAFTVEDLDGDGSDEAIVFYETARSAEDENPLRICLLDQQNGRWSSINSFPTAGAEVDRVDIRQLGSNSRINLIVSYSMVDGAEHAAQIYHCEDGKLVRSLSVNYSAMAMRDLDLDGTTELFVTTAAKAPNPASAVVYALDEEGRYQLSRPLNLPESVTDVMRLNYGILPGGAGENAVPAIYLDCAAGATTAQTVIASYSEGKLSAVYADSADQFLNSSRPAGCQSMDIDGDGEIEIPANSVFYGYSNTAEGSPLSMTSWCVCRGGLLIREHASYYAQRDGYIFVIPTRWEKRVTAISENEEIVFYEIERGKQNSDGSPVLKEPLLRLAAVDDPVSADALQTEGYLLLRRQNGTYCLGKSVSGSSSLRLTESELLFAMHFI